MQVGSRVKVQIGRQFMLGRYWSGGWRVGRVIGWKRYQWGMGIDVQLLDGTVLEACNSACVKEA